MKQFVAWCDCGFRGAYRTTGLAEHALRRHSCEKQARLRAARKPSDAAVDRTPRPCRHKAARHAHGTYAT